MTVVNWGIIAPGGIAKKFATALNSIEHAHCYGVAGRSLKRSQSFASEFGFDKAFGNCTDLLSDPKLDVVYIASPHNAHHQHALAAIHAGKAVLCEKPLTVNYLQSEELVAAAAQQEVFLMEAVWTRFLPIYGTIREWLDQQVIGDVRLVQSSFGLNRPFDPNHRLFNPDLAGGSILDLGIYPVSLADWVFDEQTSAVQATGHLGVSQVDEEMTAILSYSNGKTAQIYSALSTLTPHAAVIYGTEGHIEIHPPAHGSEAATLCSNQKDSKSQTITLPHAVNGYVYQAQEVQQCLAAGKLESKIMPWSTSLRVMKILDELRAQVGVKYPFENVPSKPQ